MDAIAKISDQAPVAEIIDVLDAMDTPRSLQEAALRMYSAAKHANPFVFPSTYERYRHHFDITEGPDGELCMRARCSIALVCLQSGHFAYADEVLRRDEQSAREEVVKSALPGLTDGVMSARETVAATVMATYDGWNVTNIPPVTLWCAAVVTRDYPKTKTMFMNIDMSVRANVDRMLCVGAQALRPEAFRRLCSTCRDIVADICNGATIPLMFPVDPILELEDTAISVIHNILGACTRPEIRRISCSMIAARIGALALSETRHPAYVIALVGALDHMTARYQLHTPSLAITASECTTVVAATMNRSGGVPLRHISIPADGRWLTVPFGTKIAALQPQNRIYADTRHSTRSRSRNRYRDVRDNWADDDMDFID
jgi:hypothetical protein